MGFSICHNKSHLDESAKLYVKYFSEPGREWSFDAAKNHLNWFLEHTPWYCPAIYDSNTFLGALFAKDVVDGDTRVLFLDTLLVGEEHQQKGVGSLLIKEIVSMAVEENIPKIFLEADERKKFPKKWYEKMGFAPTGWVEYGASTVEIKL